MTENLGKAYKVLFTGKFNFGFNKIISIYDTKKEAIQETINKTLFKEAEHCVVYRINYFCRNNGPVLEKETKVAVLK